MALERRDAVSEAVVTGLECLEHLCRALSVFARAVRMDAVRCAVWEERDSESVIAIYSAGEHPRYLMCQVPTSSLVGWPEEERVCSSCGSYDEIYGRHGEFGCFGEWHPIDCFEVPFPEVQGCPHWEAR